ncbi:chromatin target of PRMT1 protein-like isoform X1 [Labrus bergylta]|uniref:chromatin target of PRMT1 protein-like isoform X1 n=2 Tax=Labrus bergylta TaxID=56723 RepID=UPI003313D306
MNVTRCEQVSPLGTAVKERMNHTMDSSRQQSFFLRSTTAVSLHERFSQVLTDQLTQSMTVTLDPIMLQQMGGGGPQVLLLLKSGQPTPLHLQAGVSSVTRRSVWTRLGWQPVTRRLSIRRPRGFWSFRNKYRWRARFTSRSGEDLRSRLGQRRLQRKRNFQKLTAAPTQLSMYLHGGGAKNHRGQGWNRGTIPTRKQLDTELDDYMSLSKRRLDQELDRYMSMTKSRLDAQLDEYMAMAGDTDLTWD